MHNLISHLARIALGRTLRPRYSRANISIENLCVCVCVFSCEPERRAEQSSPIIYLIFLRLSLALLAHADGSFRWSSCNGHSALVRVRTRRVPSARPERQVRAHCALIAPPRRLPSRGAAICAAVWKHHPPASAASIGRLCGLFCANLHHSRRKLARKIITSSRLIKTRPGPLPAPGKHDNGARSPPADGRAVLAQLAALLQCPLAAPGRARAEMCLSPLIATDKHILAAGKTGATNVADASSIVRPRRVLCRRPNWHGRRQCWPRRHCATLAGRNWRSRVAATRIDLCAQLARRADTISPVSHYL